MIRAGRITPPKAQMLVIVTALLAGGLATRLPDPALPGTPAGGGGGGTAVAETPQPFRLYTGPGIIAEDILARPLLSQSRKPAPTGPAPEETAVLPEARPQAEDPPDTALPPARPQVALRGFMDKGAAPRALISWGDDGVEEWYGLGDERDGWRIVAIGENSVRIASETDEFTVNLFGD